MTSIDDYSARVTAELQNYADCEAVQDLPEIHHLWAHRFVGPLLAEEGVASIDELWDREVAAHCARRSPEPTRLVSLGAGNGEIELPLAARLAERGVTNLEIVMLELNRVMIDRALAEAKELGIADRVRAEQADLNTWVAGEDADVYLASHCLHHVVELEHLYDQVARSLDVEGVLLVNDMIGRNGHVRWPEALELVRRIWAQLPERHRYNHALKQTDKHYPDLDCSTVGFEGIRSQDVLPLLLDRLHPEIFITFGNIIDPFVDRTYGHNFDPDDPDDAAFIDAVGRLDEAAIELGLLTPTHLLATFRRRPVACRHPRGRTPERMVRRPDAEDRASFSEEGSAAAVALEAEARAAWAKYRELRSRKVVRMGLALAELRHRRRPVRAAAFTHAAEEPVDENPLICWPLDHYYSPIPNNRELMAEPARSRVWPSQPRETPGIDWRGDDQVALLRDELGRQSEFPIPSGPTGDPRDYHAGSDLFSRLDAWVLQGMLRHFRPRRMIEVGCGWSSLVTARVNREYLDRELNFTCIEPYPPAFLNEGIGGISELIASPVQETPIDRFLELGDGDVLFIDTSHTVKTGGDVPFLFEEVVPRLHHGVVVHVHDIFLPWDYPQDWVYAGRAWNEQYLVRAFLSFNSAFRVLLGVGWLSHYRRDALAAAVPGYPEAHRDGGGSLWIRRS